MIEQTNFLKSQHMLKWYEENKTNEEEIFQKKKFLRREIKMVD